MTRFLQRWPRCAAKHRADERHVDAHARQRTVAVLGHEQTGIPPEAVDLLDLAVEIPMIGTGASLNVAVAGSLVLYRLAGFL
jgi:tRNA G18 (ribose-2'-O)-methylase SpoU